MNGCNPNRQAVTNSFDVRTGIRSDHMCQSLSRFWLFATPQTVAHQNPLSMEFSRQEYWSQLPFPSPGDLPNPGIEPRSPALWADCLPSEPSGKPPVTTMFLRHTQEFGSLEFTLMTIIYHWKSLESSSRGLPCQTCLFKTNTPAAEPRKNSCNNPERKQFMVAWTKAAAVGWGKADGLEW